MTKEQPAGSEAEVDDGRPWLDLESVKQLCRDYSSLNGNVYIKDVEACLDSMASRNKNPEAMAARIAALEAEKERMAEQICDSIPKAEAKRLVATAEAERDALRKDAERLNYLQHGVTVDLVSYALMFRVGGRSSTIRPTIRAAIDAAIAAQKNNHSIE